MEPFICGVRPYVTAFTVNLIFLKFTKFIVSHTFPLQDWIDEFRTWDPDYYCGLEEIGVLSTELWLPDLTLLNRYVKQTLPGEGD